VYQNLLGSRVAKFAAVPISMRVFFRLSCPQGGGVACSSQVMGTRQHKQSIEYKSRALTPVHYGLLPMEPSVIRT
jgi:hypothetical protein